MSAVGSRSELQWMSRPGPGRLSNGGALGGVEAEELKGDIQSERGCFDQRKGTPWCRWVAVGAVVLHKVIKVNYRTVLCVL